MNTCKSCSIAIDTNEIKCWSCFKNDIEIEISRLVAFCYHTNKLITGDYCTDCNRMDCAVDFEDLPIQLITHK